MSTDSADRSAMLEQLSALADGQLDETQVLQACQRWRGDGELRASWHAYQLIGDVLRSDDLAAHPARDAAFLSALRLRMADEPVVLAPSPSPRIAAAVGQVVHGAPSRRRAWMTPTAVAAGFVAVAGVLYVTRAPDTGSASPGVADVPTLARAALSPAVSSGASAGGFDTASVSASVSGLSPTADPQTRVASGKLIRDVRLDRYLSAHKEFAGSSALGVPSGFLRNATADASDR